MKTYKLHFIRHGMTQGNKEGKYVGSQDMSVCEEGVEELKKLIEEYDYPYIEKLYTSPLRRCRETAEIIFPNMDMTVVEEMREINFGDFEGKTYKELEDKGEFKRWLENSEEFAPPNGELGRDFLKRLLSGISMIFQDMMDNNISTAALVTHGGVIMTLFAAIGLPKHSMNEWMTGNGCGYTVILTPQMWMRDNAFEVYDIVPKKPEYSYDDED